MRGHRRRHGALYLHPWRRNQTHYTFTKACYGGNSRGSEANSPPNGFHNDTTPRFDPEAAKLAEERTIEFFNQHLNAASGARVAATV